MIRNIFLFITMSVLVTNLYAVSLEELVSAELVQQLRQGGEAVFEVQLKKPVPKLLPGDSELRKHVIEIQVALKPGMMVEALYLYKKPENENVNRVELYNQLLAISTLAGIQYYSASRGEMRTFFELSHVIDSPKSKKPLPDPVYSVPPAELEIYARQKDLTFGDNIFRYEYIAGRDSVLFIQENVTSLNVSIFPAIGKGNLRSILAVFDCENMLLVYAVSMAKTLSAPGMGDRIGNSFKNRAEALIKWFTDRADSLYNAISFFN